MVRITYIFQAGNCKIQTFRDCTLLLVEITTHLEKFHCFGKIIEWKCYKRVVKYLKNDGPLMVSTIVASLPEQAAISASKLEYQH